VRHTLNSFCIATCLVFLAVVSLAGCSSPAPSSNEINQPSPYGPGPASATGKNPLAKYIEISGFRLSESGAGKLKVKFAAINHSDADLGDMTMKVRLLTTTSKPGDEPITEFEAKIPSLGPEETKDVNATAATISISPLRLRSRLFPVATMVVAKTARSDCCGPTKL
jgi:hypothetical protein